MSPATSDKKIIIAGPNGAGKTTFARSFLPAEAHLPRFINADLIAAGLAPFAPETTAIKAGRLMLEEIEACTKRGESFSFDTTLSGVRPGLSAPHSPMAPARLPYQPVFLEFAQRRNRNCARSVSRAPGRAQCPGTSHTAPLQLRLA